jgi:hypothetical protein
MPNTAISIKKNAANVIAAVVLVVEIVVLVTLTWLTATGNVDELLRHVDARYLTPAALLIYMLIGLMLLRFGSSDSPDVAALQVKIDELQQRLSVRRLKDDEIRTIARVVRQRVAALRKDAIAAGWTDTEAQETITVQLITIENDRETQIYRADFEKAFRDGGLAVTHGMLSGVVASDFTDQFVGVVTVLNRGGKEDQNPVRLLLLDAIREALVPVNECERMPEFVFNHNADAVTPLSAVLIVGQRG